LIDNAMRNVVVFKNFKNKNPHESVCKWRLRLSMVRATYDGGNKSWILMLPVILIIMFNIFIYFLIKNWYKFQFIFFWLWSYIAWLMSRTKLFMNSNRSEIEFKKIATNSRVENKLNLTSRIELLINFK
jgi:hypothetical protein